MRKNKKNKITSCWRVEMGWYRGTGVTGCSMWGVGRERRKRKWQGPGGLDCPPPVPTEWNPCKSTNDCHSHTLQPKRGLVIIIIHHPQATSCEPATDTNSFCIVFDHASLILPIFKSAHHAAHRLQLLVLFIIGSCHEANQSPFVPFFPRSPSPGLPLLDVEC